ncbi:CDP-diacylglycerol--glycerol-3-phosphate 3-phosphatidyltransferase [Oleiphilus sp. HI0071]|uniref:CDP-diacylglycerol--glycerol-3-phosphate 3-phosphatidyltransferase n=1 Tax=unclassified Oleiphilus TaxID=2631174 RepID=UPI0007C2C8D8|nr:MULTISPECIES: CDP-diacylglycerol--glycerol-3-phosphate 3-phosphatidyltransferase [unclassified Oleiphilus]KZY61116.1 CDP-diacylglycerol--glycerol-3-phosphate 3-phosphatidyltransferase [Oleiphilus sp. HI0065]KZY90222.1 CDP-diacylglycerol--glycerol-3-phosphate 3-phosphatidyltransferase [Oleiphilus sp. HI0071]KZY91961.1 CDP-diacylglycerol--glycerol-3-phosphate 3-phosphatidyltransferase [Oleiphilus sp. HI0073]KZZ46496.1 CDP-diacylglycerol--glycerol-3-phosphate 3-phosphatidyltransferase [Oleiphil
MNLPNILTLSRIVLIPVFVIAFYLPYDWNYYACAAVFWIAGVTDWFDGYLARKWDQMTPFGAFLDPVADKLMVTISLAVIIEEFSVWWITIPAIVIVGREVVVSALREWMAEQGKRESVKVGYIGKVKTMCQMSSIFFLLIGAKVDESFWFGYGLMVFAAILTMWSMVQYLSASWGTMFGKESLGGGGQERH